MIILIFLAAYKLEELNLHDESVGLFTTPSFLSEDDLHSRFVRLYIRDAFPENEVFRFYTGSGYGMIACFFLSLVLTLINYYHENNEPVKNDPDEKENFNKISVEEI
jgi:hypothetical protein